MLQEATSAVDFLPNWACTHGVSRHFLCSQDISVGLSSILHLDAQTDPMSNASIDGFPYYFILLFLFLYILIYFHLL